MRPLILTDLDDTLFQTLRKCAVEPKELKLMSTLIDGSPSSYASLMQQHFLSWLRIGQVVPVTARSASVLARVDIEQAPAIVSNGGSIINDDATIDQAWHDHLASQATAGDSVHEVYRALIHDIDNNAFRHWVVSENELPLYVVIKSNDGNEEALTDLALRAEAICPAVWRRHSNGNNLALLPPWLNKRHAAAYFIDKRRASEPDTPVIGIGDSVSDVGFMDLCDFAIAPTRSQLWMSVNQNNAWVQ